MRSGQLEGAVEDEASGGYHRGAVHSRGDCVCGGVEQLEQQGDGRVDVDGEELTVCDTGGEETGHDGGGGPVLLDMSCFCYRAMKDGLVQSCEVELERDEAVDLLVDDVPPRPWSGPGNGE